MNIIRVSGCVLKSLQSCSTLCNPMNCSPPGSCVHGVLQAEILEWVAMPSSRGSSWPRDWTWCISVTAHYPRKLRENGLNLLALKLFQARSCIQKRFWLEIQTESNARKRYSGFNECMFVPSHHPQWLLRSLMEPVCNLVQTPAQSTWSDAKLDQGRT